LCEGTSIRCKCRGKFSCEEIKFIAMETLEQKAIEVIKKIEYLNISSITPDGEPWGSPVYTAFDKELNFYWLSWKENQHSKNIQSSPNVFITIYDSTVPCGTGLGVYMKGTVKKLTSPIELGKVLITFYKRRNKDPRNVKHFLSKYPRRVYKFTPTQAWVNGDSEIKGNFIDIRKDVSLEKIREII